VRRVVAAITRHRGALLADPVGSGKSYVALAVAWALDRATPPLCLVPAALAAQWLELGQRLGVPLTTWSHERASRGRLPPSTRGLVIIDESHRFRHPNTRRYTHVARWLAGTPTLLLSATPAVNTTADVAHQLLLAVRDDVLAPHGIRSLMGALEGNGKGETGLVTPAALGHLVLASPGPRRPTRVERTVPVEPPVWLDAAVKTIDALHLSDSAPVAALLRGVLLRAAASSPAALLGAARRYQRLLRHASEAAEAGSSVPRAALRALIGGREDQLLFWPLLGELGADGSSDLAIADLDPLRSLVSLAHDAVLGPDPKVRALQVALADERPTLVFAIARDTVRHLRDRLGGRAVAWCTGERAGLGHSGLPREVVLGWFRRSLRDTPRPPADLLVATDVAAEGFDLTRVERVVHYDLPWTAVRLEQREGRARRAGVAHEAVEVVEMDVPDTLARRLHQRETVALKARLPSRIGLADADARWRWRADLVERAGGGEAREGRAAVTIGADERARALVGIAFESAAGDGAHPPIAQAVLSVDECGTASDAGDAIDGSLALALRADAAETVGEAEAAEWIARVVPTVRARLRLAASARWVGEPSAAARLLVQRLQQLARTAARRRDRGRLLALERALRFVAGGHTAGEAALVRALAEADTGAVLDALRSLPAPSAEPGAVAARVTGLIVLRPDQAG
jgi:predicted transcriptional regulator